MYCDNEPKGRNVILKMEEIGRKYEDWVEEVLTERGSEILEGFVRYYNTNRKEDVDRFEEKVGYRLRGVSGACIGFDGIVEFLEEEYAPVQLKYVSGERVGCSLETMWREAFYLVRGCRARIRDPILVTTASVSVTGVTFLSTRDWEERFGIPLDRDPAKLSRRVIIVAAQIRRGDTNGRTALHKACKNGWLDVVKHLVMHADRKSVRLAIRKPDMLQVLVEDNNVLREYAEKLGAEKGVEDRNERVVEACAEGDVELVKKLWTEDADYATCLAYACREGNLSVVKYLVGLSKGKLPRSCLIKACQSGNCSLVSFLIGAGAFLDPDCTRVAAERGDLQTLICLGTFGLQPTAKDMKRLKAMS